MTSKFIEAVKSFTGVVQEANNPDNMTSNGLPDPNTEVTVKADAMSHPYVKSKDAEFQERIKGYIADNASEEARKNKKYRLLISGVTSNRVGMEYAANQSGPIAYMAGVLEQEGPFTRMSITLPLELLETENASWNAMQSDVPDSWKSSYKHTKFTDLAKAFSDDYNKGKSPERNVDQTNGNPKEEKKGKK